MFGTQRGRLLRESWKNATLLAEELYAMMSDDIPLEHNAPVTITNPAGTKPPLTLRQYGDSNTYMNFVNKKGQPAGSIVYNPALGGPQIVDPAGVPLSWPPAGQPVSPNYTFNTPNQGGPQPPPGGVQVPVIPVPPTGKPLPPEGGTAPNPPDATHPGIDPAGSGQPPAGGGTGSFIQTTFVGRVMSGSGENYQMRLFADGKDGEPIRDPTIIGNPPKLFTVQCVDIDDAETVPPGSFHLVVLVGSVYQFQANVFYFG